MTILLDTNVLTWLHQNSSRLGKKTAQRIEEAHIVYFSPLTYFEWLQKDKIDGITARAFIAATRELGFIELPLSAGAAEEATRFGPLRNRDPLDSLILAQASYEDVDFYTSDQRILDLGLSFVKDSSV
jgi:PIN domain nuclease of toxin-antitoxin system